MIDFSADRRRGSPRRRTIRAPWRRIVPLVLALSIPAMTPAAAQQPKRPQPAPREVASVGVYAGYALTTLDAAFAVDGSGVLTSSGACGRFERGNGSGPLVGALLEFPLATDLRLAFGLEYEDRSATLRYRCVDLAEMRVGSGLAPAITEFVADVRHSAVTARLMASYRPFALPLTFQAGPAISLTTSGTYDVREEIVSPAGAEFLQGGQVRPYGSGKLTSGGPLHVALTGGIGYPMPLGERWSLRPELSYLIGLSQSLPSAGITPRALRLTLGIARRFDEEPREIPPPPPPVAGNVPTEGPTPPRVTLELAAIDEEGVRSDTLSLTAVRTIGTRLHPLLTYLFFERGESELPARYVRRRGAQATAFSESTLRDSSTLGIYYNVLDIIGSRMRRSPAASIRVTGTEPDAATADGRLARARAERVREYLTSTWGIDGSRIEIASRRDPSAQSNPETEEGMAENRRVEITSDAYEIVEPVLLSDTTLRVSKSRLDVAGNIRTGARAARWEMRIASEIPGFRPLVTTGDGYAGGGTIELDSLGADAWMAGGDATGSIEVTFAGRTPSGDGSETRRIPVRMRVESDSVHFGAGYYSLILFDFGSSRLRPEHLRTIEIVNQRTAAGTRSRVLGYTDRLGEAELNRKLSEERARSVASHLRSHVTESVGLGEETTLYDNDLPEGRFYSRGVTIETKQ